MITLQVLPWKFWPPGCARQTCHQGRCKRAEGGSRLLQMLVYCQNCSGHNVIMTMPDLAVIAQLSVTQHDRCRQCQPSHVCRTAPMGCDACRILPGDSMSCQPHWPARACGMHSRCSLRQRRNATSSPDNAALEVYMALLCACIWIFPPILGSAVMYLGSTPHKSTTPDRDTG